ncbi:hypothetical protein [Salibacterium halotolerans]|uniref:Uncharacterized protein n=1 Tax=Salibacterium halotolerans TaxID=1884432 RepID=A0A1I5NL84_9BACI|nr:hypothetical protein [Salibacterium halotolerans]SFP21991.1 hypothetical protein SAMN05518683_103177 [Salibacterium halotolerans]
MEWVILSSILLSVCLFGLSFLAGDKQKERNDEVEQMSLQVMGDMYQVKQRLRILEEELLSASSPSVRRHSKEELVKEAHQWYQQNMSIEEIAAAMELKSEEVQQLLSGTREKER